MNAKSSIKVTLLGMVMDVMDWQLKKASYLMEVTTLPSTSSGMMMSPPSLSYPMISNAISPPSRILKPSCTYSVDA